MELDASQRPEDPGVRMRRRRAILACLVIGVVLRAIPMLWGSAFFHRDQFALHPDESKIVRYADDFPGSLETNGDFRYPLLVHHVSALAWWPVKSLLGWGDDGVFVQWAQEKQRMPDEASMVGKWSYERALLFLRGLLVLIYGVGGTLLLMGLTARLGFERAVPWVAAAAALQPWPVVTTAVVQTDTAGAYMLALLFFVLVGMERRGRYSGRDAVCLGAAVGAAVAARYTSGVGVVGAAWVVVQAVRSGALGGAAALRFGGKAAVAAAVTFVGIVPGCVYRFADFRRSLEYEFRSKQAITTFDLDQIWDSLTQCAPVWILMPTVLGALVAWRARGEGNRTATQTAIAVTLAVYFAATAKSLVPDYCMPLMPVAAVLTGVAMEASWRRGKAMRAMICGWLVFAFAITSATVYMRYAADTRYQVDAWIKEHIPPGDIGMPRTALGKKKTALRAPSGYRFIDVYDEPEWVVIPHRRYRPIYKVYEDPNYFPGYPFYPVKKTLGLLTARDFEFFEDVLFEKRGKYRYELQVQIERSSWALDYRGYGVRVYRRMD